MFIRKIWPELDPVWIRISSFTAIVFMIFFSDALLAYWVPIHIQSTFNSSLVMGLVMASSSLVGLLTDIILPQLVRRITTYKLIILAGLASLTFSAFLIGSITFPFLLVFLFGMASWGIYYELLGFANKQFVASSVPHEKHAAAWAFLFTFRSLAYTIAPFIASIFLKHGSATLVTFAIFLTVFGYLLILLFGMRKESLSKDKHHKTHPNLFSEISHWKTLFSAIWPIVILSLMIGIIDASFWSVGAVLSDRLSQSSLLGSFFLSAYMFPSLFVGFLVMKWAPKTGKKRKAILFFLLASLALSLIGFVNSPVLMITIILIASTFSSFTYPLLDGVYSDVVERMGKQKLHLIGLNNSATSVAYIIGPIASGFIASKVGEQMTFSVISGFAVVVCVLLFVVTPHKLKLPQEEIHKWK